MSADSIHFPDSLKFRTLINKRTVYGGGGIMPDVFVAADTSNNTDYYRNLVRKGVFNLFVLEYADKNRSKINSEYKTFDDYMKRFEFKPEELKTFINKGEENKVKYNDTQYKRSESEMILYLKALVASNIWQTNEYFRIINQKDVVLDKALQIINDKAAYDRILGYN
jgi:carboxyl-terminal processing protease